MLVATSPQRLARPFAEAERRFDFLLRAFTPRTVFLQIGAEDAQLALLAASYVERVWSIDGALLGRAPCNLRRARMDTVPAGSVDVAFSEKLADLDEIHRVLAPRGAYYVFGQLLPAQLFREAGFERVQYFVGGLRVPAALARISRNTTTAAFK